MGGRVNVGGGGHHRTRMNAGGKLWLREKQGEHLGEGYPGMLYADHILPGGSKPRIGNDGGGSAVFGLGKKRFVFSKGQVAGLGAVSRGKPGEDGSRIALNLALEVGGDFGGSKHHVRPL